MRVLAALLVAAFLALVGVQSTHAHDSAAAPADSCAVCALAHQAQRQAPAAPPAVVTVGTWAPLHCAVATFEGAPAPERQRARAPPRAS